MIFKAFYDINAPLENSRIEVLMKDSVWRKVEGSTNWFGFKHS